MSSKKKKGFSESDIGGGRRGNADIGRLKQELVEEAGERSLAVMEMRSLENQVGVLQEAIVKVEEIIGNWQANGFQKTVNEIQAVLREASLVQALMVFDGLIAEGPVSPLPPLAEEGEVKPVEGLQAEQSE